jgi:BlaI family transcriptional regulator, penicillinase repressor
MANKTPQPTAAELAILGVLWQRGPATVREVHETLVKKKRSTGYTTTLKLLTNMHEKGLVSRDDNQRSHIYKAKAKEPHVERQVIRRLLDMAFRGSPARLVMRVLSEEITKADELEAIRKLLTDLEHRKQ